MSLKNYIFSSVNSQSYSRRKNYPFGINNSHLNMSPQQPRRSPVPSPLARPTATTTTTTVPSPLASEPPPPLTPISNENESPKKTKFLQWLLKTIIKLWQYISVEPVMICWVLPSCFLYIAVENLALEKSCRVNFGYPDVVCDNMIDKSINNIDCVEVRAQDDIILSNLTDNNILGPPPALDTRVFKVLNELWNITQLEEKVCEAEIDSQKLETELNLYTAPFDSIFGILMILFAGGWSDKKGIRKPCMLLPLLGELCALCAMLIAAIFMKQLPLEFSSILGKLLPAITGGANLMLMGVYSYLTEMTKEEDRTFRFGIFAVFVPLIPIVSLPFAGILFQKLRYIKLLLVCIPINVIGVLYIIFVLKEVKHEKEKENNDTNDDNSIVAVVPATTTNGTHNGLDNPAYDGPTAPTSINKNNTNGNSVVVDPSHKESVTEKIKHNCLVEFFNPIVAIDCFRVVVRERKHNGRTYVILILCLYFVSIGPAFGEEPNEYNFTRIRLNWDGLAYSPFATYGNAVSLAGTMLMVGGLSKLFKLSDPLVGFLGTFCSTISRIVYAAATTATMMYVARTIDMFVSVRALTLKSIVSTFVETAELGRIFSLIGIIEAFAKFVFVSIYSIVYEQTLETLPGAFYICSFFCLTATAFLFIVLYFIVKKKHKRELMEKLELDAINRDLDIRGHNNETTHM